MRASIIVCGSLLAAAAGSARAEGVRMDLQSATPAPAPTTAPPPLDLSRIRSPFALTDDQAAALRAGIARTAVDHRFDGRLTGSLGFLCGLHGETYQGAAAMRGSDPDGRFLGAKLSLAFR